MSKADYVYTSLLEDIRSAKIPGGAPIRAADVARRLGVSITPVREALRGLERDRLIRYETHHGATVIDLSDAALLEFYRVRAVVEGLGARLAAGTATETDMTRLWGMHQSMVSDLRRRRRSELGRKSQDLHLAIVDLGGPAFLGQHVRAVRNNYPVPANASIWLNAEHAAAHLDDHAQILRAIEQHDAVTAERVMAAHIERAASYRLGESTPPAIGGGR